MKLMRILALLVWCGPLLPAKTPLVTAIRQALAEHPVMVGQRLEERSAEIGLRSARQRRWFNVDLSGGFRHSTETVELTAESFPFIRMLNLPIDPGTALISSPADTFDFKLGLLQPLYSGGVLKNAIRLEELRSSAEADLTRLRAVELAGRIKASFFSVQLLRRKSDSLLSSRAGLELHQKKIEDLHREELVRKTDLLETRSRIAELDLTLQDLHQQAEAEAAQFLRLTGMSVDEIAPGHAEPDWRLEEALSFLHASHPLLLALDKRMRQAEVQRRIAAGAARPQVAGFGELHYGRPGSNFFKDEWTLYLQGGVSVTLPVFNWNRTGREKMLADLSREKILNQRRDFLAESEKNVRQIYIQKKAIEDKLALLAKLLAWSEEEALMKEKQYDEGQLDHIAYLMALSNLEKYRSQREELIVQREITRAAVQTLIGALPEEK